MSVVARILDANANRAREALRMMEDAARFALNDDELSRELKTLRHDFRAAIDQLPLPPGILAAHRNTPGDVGTQIATAAEMHRSHLLDVVIAAGKRLTESLRVIEECAKTLAASESQLWRGECFQTLRYRAYDIDGRLQLRFGSGRAVQWKLCLLLTQSLCKRPWREVLLGAIEGGCDCVQVREKHMDGGQLVRHVQEVLQCAKPRAAVMVNDRIDVALTSGADGVHLGQNDLSVHDARTLAGRNLIVGVSTHNPDEARAAVASGADYCGVGSMFATSRKPDLQPSGLSYLKSFIDAYPLTPHLAIGGITGENVRQLYEAGARGVAVSSAICAADNPAAVARMLLPCPSATCAASSSAPALRPACR